jgi:hypothetical protein
MKQGFWSSFHNQALLAGQKSFSAGICYDNRFGLNELGTECAAVIIPSDKAGLGAVISHFGYADMSRSMAGLACGINAGEKVSAGIQVDYFRERYGSDYGISQTLTIEAGIVFNASEKTIIGIHLFNPIPHSITKNNLPSVVRTGVGVMLSDDLFAGAECSLSTGSRLEVRMGFEFEAARNFIIRGGYQSEYNRFCFGTGFLFRSVQADITFTTHQLLGVTSTVSLIFKMKDKN